MREIKFRGMSKDSGKWLYGCLSMIGRYTTVMDKGVGEIVDAKTVGQYTGLKDRRGQKIYEGDILEFKPLRLLNELPPGRVEYCDEEARYVVWFRGEKNVKSLSWVTTLYKAFIAGNVYENPELLEQEAPNV